MEATIFDFKSSVGDGLKVYEDRIVISHSGILNFFAMGVHGDKTIYYTDLTAVQYKKPGWTAGHIQFSLLGGRESVGGVLAASSDENTITINAKETEEAERIVAYRSENGPFKNIEEIKNVTGIGDIRFNQIKDYITVGG